MKGVHVGYRCPGCGGRAITSTEKFGTLTKQPQQCTWTCRNCGARVRLSQRHLYGLGIVLSIPFILLAYVLSGVRIDLDTPLQWTVFILAVIAVVVGSNWIFLRFVPLQLVE